ncbi:hypothetical protein V6Z12_D02G250800 [Gossypium hirsutum]
MSVYGGDSWGREAQYRKRRIDEVVLEGIEIDDGHGSSYKKLASGKYACLVCPQNPIFDTPLMLSMHCKGSRHLAAKSKAKEKELTRQNEINKRLALEGSSTTSSINSSTTKQNARLPSKSKPLIQMAQKAASEILGNKRLEVDSRNENHNTVVPRQNDVKNATLGFSWDHNCSNETSHKLIQNHLDFRECRERELKFTSAGWKRDCHGKWYKDENVSFFSPEYSVNMLLSAILILPKPLN